MAHPLLFMKQNRTLEETMTTITPISSLAISAVPGGGDMSVAADLALLQGGKGSSFLGLFAALLNSAQPDTDISSGLPADLLSGLLAQANLPAEEHLSANFLSELLAQAGLSAGISGRKDAPLPEELARLLAREKKVQDIDCDDDTESSPIALGMLSTPVETSAPPGIADTSGEQKGAAALPSVPSAPSLPTQKAEAEEPSAPTKQGSAAAEKPLPLPANLAGKSEDHSSASKEEKRDFSNFLREASTLTQTRAANHDATRVTASLPTHVASNAWGERLGEQIIWMSRNGQQQVDLRLHPANLGPLSISLNVEGDKATIHFTVATLEVRQAIEDAMPRLREMMAANGVSLGQADVDEQTRREAEAHHMAGQREAEDQNLPGQNGEYAENSEGTPDASGQHDINSERESILPGMEHAMSFAHANGRIGGIDLFA